MAAPKRALLVIDVQNEYFSGALPIAYPDVSVSLANILRAMDEARAVGVPVVVVRHIGAAQSPVFAPGSVGAALHPSVAARPCDHAVDKRQASALAETGLGEWLRQHGVDTLSVVGYMTHNCDDSTVRQAAHEGWRVEFMHDASGALPYRNAIGGASAEEIHRVFSVVMHTGFAAVVSTDDWIAALREGRALQSDSVVASYRRAQSGDA